MAAGWLYVYHVCVCVRIMYVCKKWYIYVRTYVHKVFGGFFKASMCKCSEGLWYSLPMCVCVCVCVCVFVTALTYLLY